MNKNTLDFIVYIMTYKIIYETAGGQFCRTADEGLLLLSNYWTD